MKTVEDIKSYLIEKNGAKVAHKKLELSFNGKELPTGYSFKVNHGDKCDCDNTHDYQRYCYTIGLKIVADTETTAIMYPWDLNGEIGSSGLLEIFSFFPIVPNECSNALVAV